ncbi:MAG: spermidine/putrescine ABC transporter substrate-binding protein [Actinomycetota bacterium]
MTRSTWKHLAALLLVALVASACGGGAEDTGGAGGGGGASEGTDISGTTLVISNWDAYMPEDIVPAFEAETGVNVEYALHTTNEDVMGKITAQNGAGFDLVFVSGPFVEQLVAQNWAATIDAAQIPNLANLDPEASQLPYDPGNVHSVPYTWGTTGICYRSDLVSEAPTSWNVFHDPPAELDGKMTMLATDRWLLQPALLASGASINASDEATLDAAAAWTTEAKSHLLGFDDTTFYSKLVSGEALLVQAWDGWCNYGIAEDPNIRYVIPDEGSDLWTDAMVVLESSQNKAAAFAFIDFLLRPENHRAVAELVLYKVPNSAAMASLDPALIEQFPNLGFSGAEVLSYEGMVDLGPDGLQRWTDAANAARAS